jgi:hypothetical protein
MTTRNASFNASDDDHDYGSYEIYDAVRDCKDRFVDRDYEVIQQLALPQHGLLILERCAHGSGNAYEHRYFAVRFGKITLTRGGYTREEVVISDHPSTYTFLDCNGDYSYKLPEGSMEYVDGAWIPNTVAEYDY